MVRNADRAKENAESALATGKRADAIKEDRDAIQFMTRMEQFSELYH